MKNEMPEYLKNIYVMLLKYNIYVEDSWLNNNIVHLHFSYNPYIGYPRYILLQPGKGRIRR